MREIKFRAINAKGEIMYGLPYTDSVNETRYYKEYNNRLCWRDEEGKSCNQPYKNGTLMQYTGLKDKNGKEIYEGDIVNVPYNYIGIKEVIYLEEELRYSISNYLLSRLEIIGNIHENPELLESKND